MKKFFQSNMVTFLVLFAAAVLVSAAVYPEIFITFKTSILLWNDYCEEYAQVFVLTSFLYQGGLQLWDFFGQMPYFHTYVVLGLLKFPDVVTSVIYYLIEPFSGDSGRLFHHVFVWGYFMTLLFLRVAGIFLLLKTVAKNRVILTVGTVVFAVFFSQMAFLRGSPYMSCFPLGMYFIVRFFQDLQKRYLIAIILFFTTILSTEFLYGAYMYVSMHFFIIAGILWRLFFNPSPINSSGDYFWHTWRRKDAAWVILLMVLMIAPFVFMIKFGFHDIAFGQEHSRISHPFSPQWYFHNPELDLGSPNLFFSSNLNMLATEELYYIGISFLFLALAGLILSSNALRWFFALGVFLLWLLSFPREGINIGLIAHWINVLTNPLKTLARSYRLSYEAMLPYLLMPLAVMGIEAMLEVYRGKKFSGFALGLLGLMTVLLVSNSIPVLPPEARVYLIAGTVLLLGGLGLMHFKDSPRARHFLVGTVCLLSVIDVFFIIYQSKNFLSQFCFRKPTILDAAPQSGMVEYDFANPVIFPYRYTYVMDFSYRDEGYLWVPHGISSDFHHVVNQLLNFVYLNGYSPRHVEFAKWLKDPEMLTYLQQNNEFIFLAQSAINASPDALSRISSAGLAKQVVEVEDPGQSLDLPDKWPSDLTHKDPEELQYSQILGTLAGVNTIPQSKYHLQGDMIVYTLNLPANFPGHLASSWFLPEQRYLRFFVEGTPGQWQELQATQGELIRPYTFDVQNIKKGELRAAFPMANFPLYHRCVLLYPSGENQGVVGLFSRQFDNLGFTYLAKRDGWLVGHYPYDPKWKISVDGRQIDYYRTDKSFIGFPLTRGKHQVLIQYWPDSPLRFLLLVSALVTTLMLPILIFLALKWENKDMSADS